MERSASNHLTWIDAYVFPPEWLSLLVGALAVLVPVQTAALTLLAMKVYNIGIGILLGIGAMIPCLGLQIVNCFCR
jgi:hypothetical protein